MRYLQNKTKIMLMFLILFMVFSCKKEEIIDPLPPNTEIGANTFIFRVNGGEIIESEVESFLPISPRISVLYNHIDTVLNYDFHFFIKGSKIILEDNKTVGINIKSMSAPGKYTLFSGDGYTYSYYFDLKPNHLNYYTNKENQGELNITKLDTNNHIIAGRFKFDAKRHFNGEELEEYVTIEGQFDVKYKPNISVDYYNAKYFIY